MNNSISGGGRLLELDAMRGIAAMMVVLYHYTTWHTQSLGYSTTVPLFEFKDGKLGVHFFFIVSGFVILLTMNSCSSVYQFAMSRFARLYPAYWVAVILTFAVLVFFPIPGREVTLSQALINLTMLQKWLRVPPIDGVYWTLAVELTFYVLMAIVFQLRLLRRIELVSSLWLVLIIAVTVIERQFGVRIGAALKLMLLIEYGSLFISGVMLYRIFSGPSLATWLNFGLAFLVSCFLFTDYLTWMVLFHGVFLLFALGRANFLKIPALVFLGQISYSLYLVHQNIGYVIINWLEKTELANSLTIVLVPTMVAVFLSWVIYRTIEVPARRFIKRVTISNDR